MGTLYCIRTCNKKKSFLGFKFPDPLPAQFVDVSREAADAAEYVGGVVSLETIIPSTTSAPLNLPIAVEPIVGYQSLQESEEIEDLNELENQAHAKKVLLSSDAMRYFIAKVASKEDRELILDTVIGKARVLFPSEDGWIVINLSRMESILDEVNGERDAQINDAPVELGTFTHLASMTAGSLAEAVASGNTLAAYDMIAHRPMVALADAAADFDAVYRNRKGELHTVSNLLKEETSKLSDEQLANTITALTSALDGTYPDEASAVKMAIMKAIQIVG